MTSTILKGLSREPNKIADRPIISKFPSLSNPLCQVDRFRVTSGRALSVQEIAAMLHLVSASSFRDSVVGDKFKGNLVPTVIGERG